MDPATLTNAAAAARLRAVRRGRRQDPAATSWSTSSIAASRRRCRCSPASTAARSARCACSPRRRPPTPPTTRARSASATATSPTIPAALSGERHAGEHLATTRDAPLRLDRRAAGRASRRRSACPPILYLFDHGYPAADEAGLHAFHASELPYVFGTLDRTPPQWPKIPATPRESRAVGRDGRLLDQLRAHRPPHARPTRPPGRLIGHGGAYMHFADAPQPGDRPVARHVRAQRAGGLPPPRRTAACPGTGMSASPRRRCRPRHPPARAGGTESPLHLEGRGYGALAALPLRRSWGG